MTRNVCFSDSAGIIFKIVSVTHPSLSDLLYSTYRYRDKALPPGGKEGREQRHTSKVRRGLPLSKRELKSIPGYNVVKTHGRYPKDTEREGPTAVK